MTRTEFVRAFSDLCREVRRQTKVSLTSTEEAEAHIAERNTAANIWRRDKNRLQRLTVDEWRKQEAKS